MQLTTLTAFLGLVVAVVAQAPTTTKLPPLMPRGSLVPRATAAKPKASSAPSASNCTAAGTLVQRKVSQGDTLTKIATELTSGICNIATKNNITNPDLIFPDQVLNVPANLCAENIDNTSCLPKRPENGGTQVCVQKGKAEATRTIKAGDTFIGIATELDLNVQKLLDANPGVDRFNLEVGQVVNIPICA